LTIELRKILLQGVERRRIAGNQPEIEQADMKLNVLLVEPGAFRYRSH
jgi:hypothetical protein